MLYKVISALNKIRPFPEASAHCDIPCGIYDPSAAQISALTVIRMIDLIEAIEGDSIADKARLTRLVLQKEEHAEQVKKEVRIIWGDYCKALQFEKVPGLHELTHSIMMQASKCRQSVDRGAALELLELVNKFAEEFWLTKGFATFKATCPYPPAEKVVYPKLTE